MYEAEEYHGGGGHHTQGEEGDTERARLKRSASLSSSSHRSHHSRHREAHGVNTTANQKALLWHMKANQKPDTGADHNRALIQEQRVKIRQLRADSDIHLWQGYGWSMFSKVWFKSTQCWVCSDFYDLWNWTTRILDTKELTNCFLSHPAIWRILAGQKQIFFCLLLLTSIPYFAGQVPEDGD